MQVFLAESHSWMTLLQAVTQGPSCFCPAVVPSWLQGGLISSTWVDGGWGGESGGGEKVKDHAPKLNRLDPEAAHSFH